MTWVARTEDLTVHFRLRRSRETVKALSGVTIDVPRDGALGVIGESGSGKTTLGRCLAGLVAPTTGRCELARDADGRAVRVQMLFQDPESSLDPRLRIRASIEEMRRSVPGAPAPEEVMAQVGLAPEVLELLPRALSPAAQQLAAIARALAGRPDLLILDEPVTALDLVARAEVLALLDRIRRQQGVVLLYISHDLSTVRFLCEEVIVMYLGRVVERGPVEGLLERPGHPYSLALLSSSLSPDPRVRTRPYRLAGEIPSAINPPAGCGLHPRCPRSDERCREVPAWQQLGPGQLAACWHPVDEALRCSHLGRAGEAA